jgi:hypothetical protein
LVLLLLNCCTTLAPRPGHIIIFPLLPSDHTLTPRGAVNRGGHRYTMRPSHTGHHYFFSRSLDCILVNDAKCHGCISKLCFFSNDIREVVPFYSVVCFTLLTIPRLSNDMANYYVMLHVRKLWIVEYYYCVAIVVHL